LEKRGRGECDGLVRLGSAEGWIACVGVLWMLWMVFSFGGRGREGCKREERREERGGMASWAGD